MTYIHEFVSDNNLDNLENTLNIYSAEGWEVVNFSSTYDKRTGRIQFFCLLKIQKTQRF